MIPIVYEDNGDIYYYCDECDSRVFQEESYCNKCGADIDWMGLEEDDDEDLI